jgi:murein DD-endopeptidase MepM/ murein hydrolase activator NlpD
LTEDDVRLLTVGSEEFYDYHEAQRGRVRFRYTIRPGDTLTSIARRFDLSVASLSRINRFGRRTDIRAGEQIIVYAARDAAPTEAVRAADNRMQALSDRWDTAPPEPAPPLLDDGDGEAEAADHVEEE